MSLQRGAKKKMQIMQAISLPNRQIQTVILRRPNGRDFALRFGASPPTIEKMIPALDEGGLLPEGIHDGTLAEAEAHFGKFQGSDRRVQLWRGFVEFLREAKTSGLVEMVLLDGSFVTAKPTPNDIDLVVVVFTAHDFGADLPPHQYNVLAQQRVRRRFGCDIVVVRNGTDDLTQAVEFFTQVRQQPGRRKGLLRLKL